jgi:hypothetical protein
MRKAASRIGVSLDNKLDGRAAFPVLFVCNKWRKRGLQRPFKGLFAQKLCRPIFVLLRRDMIGL